MPKVRKILNDWNAPYIQSLMKLVETQSKETLATWAIGYCQEFLLPLWNKYYPKDLRPKNALDAALMWLSGEIKLPDAKKKILSCHKAARESEGNPAAQAAARAIAQSASAIHSPRHSMGLAFYGSLALSYDRVGINTPWDEILDLAALECARMEAALKTIAVENEPNPVKITWRC